MDSRKVLVPVAVTVALILAAQQRSGGQQDPTPAGPPTITFQGREIPNTLEEILNPKHTVLVVHEMLNDFISEGGASDNAGGRINADSIIQPIAELLAARAKNVRVAYVRWTRHADGSTNSDPVRRNADFGTGPLSNIEGTWGWEEPEAIKPMPGDWVLPKWRPDAPATTSAAAPAPRTAPDMKEVLDPKHTVLLVHEMLNVFVSRGGSFDRDGRRIDTDAEIPAMQRLLETARSKGVRVAYVRWTSYADGSAQANVGPRTVLRPLSTSTTSNIEGTWGWEIADPVKPAEGDWVLRKYRQDAFYATPLDILMRWNGMKTLVIVGPGTEVGVLPTLMTASNLGYRRVAISDALIEVDPARKEGAMRFIAEGHA